jgi:hypothetical protein
LPKLVQGLLQKEKKRKEKKKNSPTKFRFVIEIVKDAIQRGMGFF